MIFSIAIIAKNGGENLRKLLQQLAGFIADGGEVVLLDTGSNDDTVNIATMAGCNVLLGQYDVVITQAMADGINSALGERAIFAPNLSFFDFASARNAAANACGNDYVLVLDCDFVLECFAYDALNSLLLKSKSDAYFCKWIWDTNTRHTLDHVLLYNRKTCRYIGAVHETVHGYSLAGTIPDSIFKVVHAADNKSRKQYLAGLAWQWYYNQEDGRSTHYLGRELYYRGFYRAAVKLLHVHFKMKHAWLPERVESAVLAGYAALHLKQAAEQWWLMAWELYPHRRRPLIALAEFYRDKKCWIKCAAYAAAAMEVPYTGEYNERMIEYAELPYELRYLARHYMGLHEGARADFDLACSLAPGKYEHDRRHIYGS